MADGELDSDPMFENQTGHLSRKNTHKSLNWPDLGACTVHSVRLGVFVPCPLTVLPQVHQPRPQFCLQPLSYHPACMHTHSIMNKKWKISKMHEKHLWRGTEIKTQTQPADKYLNCPWPYMKELQVHDDVTLKKRLETSQS